MFIKEYNKYLILILALISPVITNSSFANTFGDVDIGIISDDNLTRSDYSPDKKAGTAIEFFADYGKFFDLKNNWSATGSIYTQYTNHIDFTRLSTLGLGTSASARKKLGIGAYSSSIRASLSLAVNTVTDSRRSNNAVELGLSWDKRLNDIWEFAAGLTLESVNAKNSVFDSSGTTVYASADYNFSEKLLFSFGVSQRSGDIISVTNASANPSEATYAYLSQSSGSNWISDDVYGSGLTAYRIKADTFIIKASLSYALNNSSSINAGFENQNSKLGYGISYKNNILRANYIYSF